MLELVYVRKIQAKVHYILVVILRFSTFSTSNSSSCNRLRITISDRKIYENSAHY